MFLHNAIDANDPATLEFTNAVLDRAIRAYLALIARQYPDCSDDFPDRDTCEIIYRPFDVCEIRLNKDSGFNLAIYNYYEKTDVIKLIKDNYNTGT